MMKYFNSVLNTTVGFPENKRGPLLPRGISRFTSLVFNGGWLHSRSVCDCIFLSVDRNIKIHTVCFFGSKDNKYSVSLTVADNDHKIAFEAKRQICSVFKHAHSKIGDYQGFDVVCEPPISLKANTKYYFRAHINGPPTWYGENGQSSVKHSRVTFLFADDPRVYTSVEKGQYSEFLFTLD